MAQREAGDDDQDEAFAHLLDRGLVRPPLFVQMIFGILGGMGADPENLLHMRRLAQSLFGDAVEWSVLAAGRHQMAMATMGSRAAASMARFCDRGFQKQEGPANAGPAE